MEDKYSGKTAKNGDDGTEHLGLSRMFTLANWSSLVLFFLLTLLVIIISMAFLWKYTGNIENVSKADNIRHTSLDSIRREILQLEEILSRTAAGGGDLSQDIRQRVARLSTSIGKLDMKAIGVSKENFEQLDLLLGDLNRSLAGDSAAKETVSIVQRQSSNASREIVNRWLMIEKVIAKDAVMSLSGLTQKGNYLKLILISMWLIVIVTGAVTIIVNFRKSHSSMLKLLKGCRVIGSGDFSFRLPVSGSDNLRLIIEQFNLMADDLGKWSEQTLKIKKTYEMRMKQLTNFLNSASEGQGELAMPEVGESASRELIRAINRSVEIQSGLRDKLQRTERMLNEWKCGLDEEVQMIIRMIKERSVSGKMPQEGSLLDEVRLELDEVLKKVNGTMEMIRENVDKLHKSSEEIVQKSDIQEKEFHEEYQIIHETASSVNEVSVAAKQSSQMVEYVFKSAQEAVEAAEEGDGMIRQVMDSMNDINTQVSDTAEQILHLSEKSQEIGKIVGAISDISKQTNLLALNAAIEAAGAGEHGKGFAVVAKEIRELAARSSSATKEIEKLIALIQKTTNAAVMATEQGSKKVDYGVEMVNSLRESFHKIIEKFQEVVESAHQISSAAHEQTIGARQVALAISEIDKMMKESLDNVGRFRKAVSNYSKATESLRELPDMEKH